MGILDSTVEPYRSMHGLHLFHAALSSCSQRARLILEEKGVQWTSHLIDLAADENLTPEYQQLHTGGVVPALVHDGTVIIDSNDILYYIEEHFPNPSLMPEDAAEHSRIDDLLRLSSQLQDSVKLLSFTHLWTSVKKSPAQMAEYARLQQNKELVAWRQRFSDDDFSEDEMEAARMQFVAAFNILDATLQEWQWLSGEQFGVADISWTVNVHRAQMIEAAKPGLLKLDRFDRLMVWLERVRGRPSYDRALAVFNS
jgi:glutathione S-transferase